MATKKVSKKTKTTKMKKISEENSDILGVLEKPITKKFSKKTKKISSNNLYKRYSINKKESDRINFDEIYNKQKRVEDSSINFIPQEINTIPNQTSKKVALITIFAFSLLSIILCFIGLFIYRNSYNKEIIKLIENNRNLDNLYNKEKENLKIIKSVNNDLNDISTIYNEHLYWSNFINFLEKNIVKDVFIQDIFAESGGNVVISFKTNDYENISKQITVFQSFPNIINKVSINKAGSVESIEAVHDIDFKLTLNINNLILLNIK